MPDAVDAATIEVTAVRNSSRSSSRGSFFKDRKWLTSMLAKKSSSSLSEAGEMTAEEREFARLDREAGLREARERNAEDFALTQKKRRTCSKAYQACKRECNLVPALITFVCSIMLLGVVLVLMHDQCKFTDLFEDFAPGVCSLSPDRPP